jgi:hypothetical protein
MHRTHPSIPTQKREPRLRIAQQSLKSVLLGGPHTYQPVSVSQNAH